MPNVIKVREIMEKKVNPRELASEQHDVLQRHVVSVLEHLIEYVQYERYDDILNEMVFESPSGDYTGMDNAVIDFGYDGTPKDIRQILNQLAFLSDYADGNLPIEATYSEDNDYV